MFRLTFLILTLAVSVISPQAQLEAPYTLVVALYDVQTGQSGIERITTDGVMVASASTVTATVSDRLVLHASVAASPDGTALLYTAAATGGKSQIYVYDESSGTAALRSSDPALTYQNPVWSPDGTKIAFAASAAGANEDIYVMNADGSAVTQITETPDLAERWLNWSPDGLTLVFAGQDDHLETLAATIPASGGTASPLTAPELSAVNPVWSPDGTRVYFISRVQTEEASTTAIYSAAPDGSDLQPVLAFDEDDNAVSTINTIAVSPDGQTLAYVDLTLETAADGRPFVANRLHLLDLDTGEIRTPTWEIGSRLILGISFQTNGTPVN